jgi:hypothetical protein
LTTAGEFTTPLLAHGLPLDVHRPASIAETMPGVEEDPMEESLFAALFIFSLFGPALAIIVGFALLALPTKKAVRSIPAVKEAPAHA